MPYISMILPKDLSSEQRTSLKSSIGKAIELIPEKDESKLMVSISEGNAMYFRGEEKPCAFVEVRLFGKSPFEAKKAFAAEACRIIETEAGIPVGDIFLTYLEHAEWCANGNLNSR